MRILMALIQFPLAAVLPVASADTVDDVRTRIAQMATELPVRRKHPEMLWNYDIVFATNASYRALAITVSNDWRNALANLVLCATNQFERLLVLGVRDRFGAELPRPR